MDEAPDIEPEAAAELADEELDNVEGGAAGNGGDGGNGGAGGDSTVLGGFFGTI